MLAWPKGHVTQPLLRKIREGQSCRVCLPWLSAHPSSLSVWVCRVRMRATSISLQHEDVK